MTKDTAPVTPALGFSIQTAISEGRQIVVQTHLPADATTGQIDEMLDRVAASLDRQGTKYAIEALERDLQQHRDRLEAVKVDFQGVEKRDAEARAAYNANPNRRGEYKEPAQNKQTRAQALALQARYEDEIKKREIELEKLRKKVAKTPE